ncbi:MAG TPA: DJ-1/PfpI family protein [Thermodesulfobacteriota bacterium]|nr:DJ-1/PfpI family protein [Thermodesulfobacteriota bacterium]
MKKLSLFAILVILALIVSLSSQTFAQGRTKVHMIPREGYSADLDLMIKMEIGVMKLLLKKASMDVDIATTTGIPIVGSTEKVTDIMVLRNINIDNYAGVIIACLAVGGGGSPSPAVPPEVIEIVRKALSDGKPVAGNGNAPVVLAEAGVLKGKKYSYMRDPLTPTGTIRFTISAFEGAIYSGSGLVQDGLIITSGVCPNIEKAVGMENGTVRLTKAFIAAVQGTLTYTLPKKAQTMKPGTLKTIKLPSGEEVYDLNGEWDVIVENYGTHARFGTYPNVFRITQTGNTFDAIRVKDNPPPSPGRAGSPSLRGELETNGFKAVWLIHSSGESRPSKGEVSEDGKKIVIDDGMVRVTLTRK